MNPEQQATLEEAGIAVLTMTEGIERAEFLGSRLTRRVARADVLRMADTLEVASAEVRQELPEIDWAAWQTIASRIRGKDAAAGDEALWFAIHALVPATLMWLRHHGSQVA